MAEVQTYSPPETKIVHVTQTDFNNRPSIFTPVHLVQYDKRLPIVKVELFNRGEKYILPEGAEVNIRVGKKGALFVLNPVLGCTDDRSAVYFEVTQQMVTDPGEIHSVLELFIGTDNAYSAPIIFNIDKNPVQEGSIESVYEFKTGQEMVAEAKKSQEEAKKSETNAAESAENARSSEESAAQSKETALNASQSAADSKAKAAESAENARNSELNAKASEDSARTSEVHAATSEENAASSQAAAYESETNAKDSENNAKRSEENASGSEQRAATSETNAKDSETKSAASQAAAKTSEDNAKTSEENAANSEKAAKASEEAAETSKNWSESYCHGGTGLRENEDIDNSEYYYKQNKAIAEARQGIVNMGSCYFKDLETVEKEINWMYNVIDEFTSDDRFTYPDVVYGAGTNVIWTGEEKWDAQAGTAVVGIKGNAETAGFRKGNVLIEPQNLKVGEHTLDTLDESAFTSDTAEETVTFTSQDSSEPVTEWTDFEPLKSGEKHKSIFQKLSALAKNSRFLNLNKISSHVGMVIMSTTLDTKEKVEAMYVGTWEVFAAGRTLVGVDPAKGTIFSTVKATGGSKDAVVVSHTHTQQAHNHSQAAHNHSQSAHMHNLPYTTWGASTGTSRAHFDNGSNVEGSGYKYPYKDMEDNYYISYTNNATATNVATTATNVAATAVNNATGVSGTNANLPPYETLYIWERVA